MVGPAIVGDAADMRRFPFQRFLLGVCIATIVAIVIGSGPAFTAPADAAGPNGGNVSGYAVSNVHYALDGNRVSLVTFDLDAPARSATVRINDVEAPCTVSGRSATCALATELPVAALGSLSVTALS
jgi:hypothetical protein